MHHWHNWIFRISVHTRRTTQPPVIALRLSRQDRLRSSTQHARATHCVLQAILANHLLVREWEWFLAIMALLQMQYVVGARVFHPEIP
jgi:hypothetical protein